MQPEIVQKLLELNQQFYAAHADEFSQTRQTFSPGFEALRLLLPQPCPRLLDVGCGNGRFGQYLQQHQAIGEYVGVDFSGRLLEIAPTLTSGTFYACDISQPDFLDGLDKFEAIACLAVLHHIPGRANRVRLLQEMGEHLAEDGEPEAASGRLLLSTWQFATSDRQQRKIRDWAEVGLSPADVEVGDYLLTWQQGGFAYRYACQIDGAEMANLAAEAGLTILHQFRSDGREGNLSLYTVVNR